ncbi:EAL domain-containing protein [Paraburkholderia sp. D15]|uniref:putative bifunctional diguanylate cyclase/phosphodiesterase n=1 Tax=Paraburkholderia sp. D15 TaxID=2880218 RepID=UPI002478BE6C|nr:EAL domain-containing protein [Paraburkholderia sp. D15]WGS52050.1 EAL domain-containing protein [Paraburkholderia sp. D15]
MVKPQNNRTQSGPSKRRDTTSFAGLVFQRELAARVFTGIVVMFILSAIGLNTFLARRQTHEQENSVGTLHEWGRLKRDLDQVQQIMLDEHGELNTLIGTRAFYNRAPYFFPMTTLLDLTNDARVGCRERKDCLSRLDELDDMMRELGARSETLAVRVNQRPGSVSLGDPALNEIDAYFYSVLEHVVDVRMEADGALDSVVSKSSSDAKWVSDALLVSGFTAAALLFALLRLNARIARRLRAALRLADSSRAKLFESKQTLEYVLDNIPQGIAWKNAKHCYVGGNEIYARDAGLASRDALIGLSDHDLLWGTDANVARDEDVRVMSGELTRRHHERAATAVDGSEVWISETKLPLKDQHGNTDGVLIAYENITARRKSELALRLQGRAIDASINGIVIAEVRPEGNIVIFANPSFERITGYSSEDVTGSDCDSLFQLAGDPQKWFEIRTALEQHAEANVTLPCLRKNGEQFWNNVLVAPVRDEQGKVTHHVGVMSDVTALVEYQARLEHQARYDALTDLPNRMLLDERLAEAIKRAADSSSQVSVMFLDLDRFKEVNDSLGHRVGDTLLASVAQRLQRLVRANDLVARYGGDEFIIVAARASSEQLVPMLERLIAAMAEPFYCGERELYVEASVGVSTFPQDGGDADTLIRNADAAMYLAKSRGRNGYQFYRPELNRAAAERLHLSTRLRRAAKSKSLQVAYQPQIDMVTGRIFGVEALLRWHDAELGVVSPALFIPIAEETGLIQGIGEWVLRTACEQAARWRAQGLPPIRVSVNVSPVQLERSDLVGVVRSALQDAGCQPDMLELEVTEGALMRNAADAARVLHDLRELGVKIAIDDFGTGYSSLSYLQRFSVDRIKIDKVFVQEIGRGTECEALTLAVIAIADALKFDVIAEGVETDEQRGFLVKHGCSEGQGFLYSAAVSSDAIAGMLRSAAEQKEARVQEQRDAVAAIEAITSERSDASEVRLKVDS